MSSATRRTVAWILGFGLLVTGLVIGASMALDDDGAEDADGQPTGVTVAPFLAPTGPATDVSRDRIVVSASSFLAPVGAITYGPDNTVDGDPSTAWNSDAPGDQGRGEQLSYRFSEPVDLQAIRFVNGYAKDPEIYAANHRIKELRVTTDVGTQTVNLLDTSDQQEIVFGFGYTSKVVFEVVDVYLGAGFANPDLTADLALSEVEFLAIQP